MQLPITVNDLSEQIMSKESTRDGKGKYDQDYNKQIFVRFKRNEQKYYKIQDKKENGKKTKNYRAKRNINQKKKKTKKWKEHERGGVTGKEKCGSGDQEGK